MAQAPAAAPRPRPTPPTRDPHSPGYVTAKELPDGVNAPANVDGNFILGPTHSPAPEMAHEGVPQARLLDEGKPYVARRTEILDGRMGPAPIKDVHIYGKEATL